MITPLCERLSRDDDLNDESNSISNQKLQLEDYAHSQGFQNFVHFADDGISGTGFDCLGFLATTKEVKSRRVQYLLIKDMNRLWRDYLKVAQITEILRQCGVRLMRYYHISSSQIGWRSHIQSIFRENNSIECYEKVLRGKYANVIGEKLFWCLCEEIAEEFQSVDSVPAILRDRHCEKIGA